MFEFALQLIEKEKKERTGVLDLGNCGLSRLPEELFRCEWLEALNLGHYIDFDNRKKVWKISNNGGSRNVITKLPSELGCLSRLKKLTVVGLGIQEINGIESLPDLATLDLSRNEIKCCGFLKEQKALEYLSLSYNKISDGKVIENLTNLKSLDIAGNLIHDFSFLQHLVDLSALYLGGSKAANHIFFGNQNNLTGSFLGQSPSLERRPLGGYTHSSFLHPDLIEIKDYGFLENIQNLKLLDLSYNKLTNIDFLESLNSLISLDLTSNEISDVKVLEKFGRLTELYLGYNKITDIQALENLTSLTELHLNSNEISNIGPLEKLKRLHFLNVSHNQITSISGFQKWTDLISLEAAFNEITNIAPSQNVTKLKSLYLESNHISDIRFLMRLTSLRNLSLRNNVVIDIRPLRDLTNLVSLDLSYNKIKEIPSLGNLNSLTKLNLSSNQITDVSPLKEIITKGIPLTLNQHETFARINLFENPISTPPIEIVNMGNKAVTRYFADLKEQGKDFLFEAKLLIVGEGESGKTTLAWKLKDINAQMPHKEHDRTQGIEVRPLDIKNISFAEKPFRMNVWDFGGQEIYHATHQFFLTKRSLYVLLNNTRNNLTDFNHWLQMIGLFSENSPVIIVQNEVAATPTDLDLRGLQQYFDNILKVHVTDLSKKDDRLEKLIRDICFQVQQLNHVGIELPKQWVKIRQALEKVSLIKPYISDKEFYQICYINLITTKNQIKRLASLLHDLGVFLFFYKDPILKHTVILQNNWVTQGVYKVLDNRKIKNQNGHFSYSDAITIWDNTEFEGMHDELLQLMAKFELCYRIPYSKPTRYVCPQLLPVEKPKYQWSLKDNLIIVYEYDFMPKGMMAHLIVRLYRYIKDIYNLAWRNGCIFTFENTNAQVIETYGRKKMEIRIKGSHCARLSTIILKEIDELNASFSNLKFSKKVPCNCSKCIGGTTPHFYDYTDLMRRKEYRKETVECTFSFELVSVEQILEGIFERGPAWIDSIPDLLKKGKIEEALVLIEKDHPEDAILLLQRYRKGLRDQRNGVIIRENWEAIRNQISASILKISRR